jgi:hypothetical protein
MREKRIEIYVKLKENANQIKDILQDDNVNFATLDKLFRERNNTFFHLKEIFKLKNIDEEEEKLAQEMIDDNNYILEQMEKLKEQMEKTQNKKEHDAKDISKYSNSELKG